jgi:hypothetical protein
MHEALCRSSGTTLDSVHAEDGPPITQRTSGLDVALADLLARRRNAVLLLASRTLLDRMIDDLENEIRLRRSISQSTGSGYSASMA